MMKRIREVELMLGKATFDLVPSAKNNLRGRRSLYINDEIKVGETLTKNNIKCVRPSMGLHPKYYDQVMGKKIKVSKQKGDRISLDDIE
jgi:pseudaminic acid synthase